MFTPFSMNLHGKLIEFNRPQVMGILNVTPDSFYVSSRKFDYEAIVHRTGEMLEEGVDIIDLGAYSTRPGADVVTEEEEITRIQRGLKAVRSVAPDIPVSVDTFRSKVARIAVEEFGADIINDVSGLSLDENMAKTVAELGVPYILMHMRGTPETMQNLSDYDNVVADVCKELSHQLMILRSHGVRDIILDPGLGFAKTTQQNFDLLGRIDYIKRLFGLPVLVGVSRKSMITKTLGIKPEDALSGTSVLNTISLLQGTSIIRVHDVAAARQAITLVSKINSWK